MCGQLPLDEACMCACVLQVLRIDAIPSKSLDTIKDWLNSVNIKYYESKLNLAWKPILKCVCVCVNNVCMHVHARLWVWCAGTPPPLYWPSFTPHPLCLQVRGVCAALTAPGMELTHRRRHAAGPMSRPIDVHLLESLVPGCGCVKH